ncbi:MAG TPA: hypothetical protein DCG57_02805 [Candidatus Riflebacteria bacterium]|nr:hypothetical protein [Candidatus Riflebacteria bacterium]
MLRISNLNARHFRLLLCLPLILGAWPAIFPPAARHLSHVWPDGPATLVVRQTDDFGLQLEQVNEHHNLAADRVIINEATHEQLVICPGIGSKTAALIIKERSFGKFYDWRDLKTRVKGISSSKIEILQDAGVKLNSNEGY